MTAEDIAALAGELFDAGAPVGRVHRARTATCSTRALDALRCRSRLMRVAVAGATGGSARRSAPRIEAADDLTLVARDRARRSTAGGYGASARVDAALAPARHRRRWST